MSNRNIKNNTGKRLQHICLGLLVMIMITGCVMAYGLPRLYASPQEKTMKTLRQSCDILYNVMDNYIDKLVQSDPLGNSSYTGDICVNEFTYNGTDYRPDVNNARHPYNIQMDNKHITLSIPDVEDGTLVIDKADILQYGLANIDPGQLKPMLKAVLFHAKEGLEEAVRTDIKSGVNADINADDNKKSKENYSIVISDEALIAAFNTAIEQSYKDSAILPYVSVLNVNGITMDNMKKKFSEYAKGVYTTCNMRMDNHGNLTGVELIFNQIGYISVEFNGESSLYDSVQMTVKTSVINDTYMNTVMQLDMQDMNNIQYSIDADVRYYRHSLKLKADGNIMHTEDKSV